MLKYAYLINVQMNRISTLLKNVNPFIKDHFCEKKLNFHPWNDENHRKFGYKSDVIEIRILKLEVLNQFGQNILISLSFYRSLMYSWMSVVSSMNAKFVSTSSAVYQISFHTKEHFAKTNLKKFCTISTILTKKLPTN